MGAAASGSEVGDITIQRIEVIHVGKPHSRINIPPLEIWSKTALSWLSAGGSAPAITEAVVAKTNLH
jgi:hypothetical protein